MKAHGTRVTFLVAASLCWACSSGGGSDDPAADATPHDEGTGSDGEVWVQDPGIDVPATDPGPVDHVGDPGAHDPGEPGDQGPEEVSPPGDFPVDVKEWACTDEWAGMGVLRVPLHWSTPWPATCRIYFGLNEILYTGWYEVNYEPETDHAFEMTLTAGHFAAVPEDGDEILYQVKAEGDQGQEGASAILGIPVDQDLHECLYPYDPTCSDGGAILCRVGPPHEGCPADKVFAAQDGCWRCVFPATCSCDDGSEAVCPMAPPQCEDFLELAIQDGCFVCVVKWTCEEPD